MKTNISKLSEHLIKLSMQQKARRFHGKVDNSKTWTVKWMALIFFSQDLKVSKPLAGNLVGKTLGMNFRLCIVWNLAEIAVTTQLIQNVVFG